MELKDKLRVLRVLKGLRQEDIAKGLGVLRSVVARHEGGIMTPRERMLAKYSRILGNVTVEWLRGNSATPFRIDVFRPLSPFSSYTHAALRAIASELSKLDDFFTFAGIDQVHVLQSDLGLVVVASAPTTVMVIIAREEICGDLLSHLSERPLIEKELCNDMFFGAITSPAKELKNILALCDIAFETDPNVICRDYLPPTNDPLQLSLTIGNPEGRSDLADIIEKILSENGIKIVSVEFANRGKPELELDDDFRKKANEAGVLVNS